MKLIETQGVRRTKDDGTLILDDVSFILAAGERLALAGASGSGKTTLLRTLALLDPPESGAILFKNEPVVADNVPGYRGRVVYLHQKAVFSDGTVEDDLSRILALGTHRQQRFDRPRLAAWLERILGDAALLTQTTRKISGGEAQVVALLRALQIEPSVLLLDEPTAALDPERARRVEELVVDWVNEKVTERAIVWVSHNQEQRGRVVTRSVTLAGGRLK